jgi:hypothetical protein
MVALQQRRSSDPSRAVLEVLTAEICACKGVVGRGIYDIGIRLVRVHEQELWRSGRYDGFEDYLERAVAISRSTAYRFMRIARHFNAAIAERYGPDKLHAALGYLEATPADEQPGDLLAAEIRIREASGRFETVTLHEATATQIREATALLRDARRAGQRIPTKVRRGVERLSEALPPAPKGTGRRDRVRLTRSQDGQLAISFHAIPLDDLEAFLAVVQQHLRGLQ